MARCSKHPADRFATTLTPKDDRAFIELARRRFQQAEQADLQQRTRELEDLEFYAGNQWPQEVLNSRQGQPGNATSGLPPVPARPSLTINKVRAPVRQVLNEEREAELGIEIVAADDFGEQTAGVSPQEIELREGLVRRIQRESQAADARSWAFARACIAGRGYYGVMTRFVEGKSFDQEIYVQRFLNQASVSLDPAHEQPDGSDAEWAFVGTDLPWEKYQAEYGEVAGLKNPIAQVSSHQWRALGDELPGWFRTDGETRSVRVVEYWYTDRVTRTLVQTTGGQTFYLDELPDEAPFEIAQDEDGDELKRDVIEKRIKWAKIDGVQVLEETDWPGKYIPIVKVVGEELQPFDEQRRLEGMVRPARDSQRAYNVMVSKWVEQIGLAPIPPWIMAAGQDEGFENEFLLSTTRTVPTLHYNQRDVNGEPVPGPPQRTSIEMAIQAIAGSVQMFDEAINDTTTVPNVSMGNIDPALKRAGAAGIRQAISQAKQGTSHYLNNLARSIRQEGLIINDLLYPIYNRPGRVARMMTAQNETLAVVIGQPFVRHPQTKNPMPVPPPNGGPPPQPLLYQLTPDATFNVTVKVTKNLDTRREQQEDVLAELVQADPAQMAIIGDLLWKYNDGPGHEELEKRYQAMLAPPVQALLSGQQGPNPQVLQLQQQVQQLTQILQSKTAEVQAKGQIDLQKTQLQIQADQQTTTADNEMAIQKAEIAAAATMSVAQAKVDAENLRSYVDALENKIAHQLGLHMQLLQQVHEAVQAKQDQAHEIGMAHLEHQHTLEQVQQAAALAPPPTEAISPQGAA
jgi:hypothetical protein